MLSYSGVTVLSFANKLVKVRLQKLVRSLYRVPRTLQYTKVDPKLLSTSFVCTYSATSRSNTKTCALDSSRHVDRVQNEMCMLKLQEVMPVYVRAVERTSIVSAVRRMEIKKEQRYAIQFCVCLGKTLQEARETLHQVYTDRCLCGRSSLQWHTVGRVYSSWWLTSDGAPWS